MVIPLNPSQKNPTETTLMDRALQLVAQVDKSIFPP